mgnify:CR=1 FL=1
MTVNHFVFKNRIKVVDFNSIIRQVDIDVVDKLYEIDEDMSMICNMSQDFRRVFMYNLIKQTCDYILDGDCKEKVLMFVNVNALSTFMSRYADNDKLNIFISKCLRDVCNKLPVNIHISSDFTFEQFMNLGNDDGDKISIMNQVSHRMQCKRVVSFEKIKKFIKNNGLTFLSETYFEDIRTKNLLFA